MGARRCNFRDPFDDPVFSALAERHGVKYSDMPRDAIRRGWDCSVRDMRYGVPEAFPCFYFQAATEEHCAVLAITLNDAPDIRYAQAAYRYVHMDAGLLSETVKAELKGRQIREVIEIPGLPDMIIGTADHSSGTLSMRLKERKP